MGWTRVVSVVCLLVPSVGFGLFNSEANQIMPRAFVCLEVPSTAHSSRLLMRVTETLSRAASPTEEQRLLPVIIDLFAVATNGEVTPLKSGLGRATAGKHWLQFAGRDITVNGLLVLDNEQQISTSSIDGQSITFACSLAKSKSKPSL